MSAPETTESTIASPTTGEPSTGDVDGFGLATVTVGDDTLVVALADRRELRRRGLMGVTDLGDLDGMLFVMDEIVRSAFTMRDTLIPLHIAFFAEDGALVDLLEMTPCEAEPCPTYQPSGFYRYAVEVPLGRFHDLDADARFAIKG